MTAADVSSPRVAVLFRTHFWDDFASRAATRLWRQCGGADFFVLADETDGTALDVRPFRKHAQGIDDFRRLALPWVAVGAAPPAWWNCDYPIYDAALRLPNYDYYFLFEFDAAANLPLLPIARAMAAAGIDCVTHTGHRPVKEGWSFAASCAGLPYAAKTWTPITVVLIAGRAVRALLAERQRLANLLALGRLRRWPVSEGFLASALAAGGFSLRPLRSFADVRHFSAESIYLETDPRTQRPGAFVHSVLDTERYWSKFSRRTLGRLLGHGQYDELRSVREQILRTGQTSYRDFRIAGSPDNLARDRPATQSSLSTWSRKPLRAGLDPRETDARGATCGVLNGQHGFHTDIEESPWWSVDLQSPQPVGEVRLFNRTDSPERARRLSIHASMDGREWTRVFQKTDDRVFAGIDDPLICRLAQPVPARHVRVALDRPDWLHLDEVEVYGPAAAGSG